MRGLHGLAIGLMLVSGQTLAEGSVLFIGNSFTFGAGSAVRLTGARCSAPSNNKN
ncbi:MAG: hypothetical protein Q7U82_00475 [Gammaproteobacteria bacterium]|nr:hypothetical protein [Gammaproteobacteria bacterium]